MEIVYVGNRNPSNRALLISNEEWKRLGKILTKKIDDMDSMEASKRLKDMRREISQKMVNGWNNTELVCRKVDLSFKQMYKHIVRSNVNMCTVYRIRLKNFWNKNERHFPSQKSNNS